MLTHRLSIPVAALTLAALTLFAHVSGAAAHERRTVAEDYQFIVGFIDEPALLEEPNGIDLRVTNRQTNAPVDGLEKTLKADVTVGAQTRTFELRARYGQKGAYTADLIPTRAGTWSFRFHGTINGVAVDERFESGPGRFNDVQPKAELQFPVREPSIAELTQQVVQLSAPAEAGEGHGQGDGHSHSHGAAAGAFRLPDGATLFGMSGLVVGALGVGLALYALRSRRDGSVRTHSVSEPV